MTEFEKATLNKCYYRSIGQMLTVDAFVVEFEVNGETYKHELPNSGWSNQTPALAFMGFIGQKPSDFENGKVAFNDEDMEVAVVPDENGSYAIPNIVLAQGAENLKNSDWFNPNGTVWNSGGNMASGGMSVDPNTGNRGGVEIDT